MRKLIILVALFFLIFPFNIFASEPQQIKAAILKDQQINSPNSGVELSITVVKIYKNYAKAYVSNKYGKSETDTVYLKKAGKTWVMLDMGTGINPTDLDIPEAVW
jgi:hypothetical protein